MAKKFRSGQIVVSGTGKDCFMGTVLGYKGKLVEVKYVDFVTPRRVPEHDLRGFDKR